MTETTYAPRLGGRYLRDPDTGDLKKLKADELPVVAAAGPDGPRTLQDSAKRGASARRDK